VFLERHLHLATPILQHAEIKNSVFSGSLLLAQGPWSFLTAYSVIFNFELSSLALKICEALGKKILLCGKVLLGPECQVAHATTIGYRVLDVLFRSFRKG